MPVVVGVDSSTSATKVEVRDSDTGQLLAAGRAPHPPTRPPRSEQDPAAWEDALGAALAQAGVSRQYRPAAVSVAAQQHGMVVLDSHDSLLRPAKLWNDTESAPDAAELVARLGPAEWAQACGSVPAAAVTITKLAWLRRVEPSTFKSVDRVVLPHDWLTWRLTGRHVTDRGDASGTGYWSPAQSRYRTDLLHLVDPDLDWEPMLPAVLGPTEAAGSWSGAMVGPGTGDNMAAALGVGARPGDLVLSLGTSGTAYTVSDRPTADRTGAVAGFADATGRYLPLICTLNATKVSDTVAAWLGADRDEFDALALAAAPGANGVVIVPHLDGERTPNRPAAAGTFTGITTATTRGDLARAAVEGVVCNLLSGADALPTVGGRLLLVGGGARSPAYRQVVADLLGRPVIAVPTEEPVARGAAVQAAAVLHGCNCDDISAAWDPPDVIVTDPTPGVDGAALRSTYASAMDCAGRTSETTRSSKTEDH